MGEKSAVLQPRPRALRQLSVTLSIPPDSLYFYSMNFNSFFLSRQKLNVHLIALLNLRAKQGYQIKTMESYQINEKKSCHLCFCNLNFVFQQRSFSSSYKIRICILSP